MMLSTDEKREIRNNILKGLQKPHVWGTTPIIKNEIPFNVHVQDLKERKHSKAISFLQEHYLTSEHLCKTVDITSSQIGMAHLLHLMLTWLRDGASLEAIAEVDLERQAEMSSEAERRPTTTRTGWHEEIENEMIGLLVCRISATLNRGLIFSDGRKVERAMIAGNLERVAFKLEHSKTYSRFRIPGIGCEEQPKRKQPKRKTSSTGENEGDETDEKEEFLEEEDIQLSEILKFRSDLELLTDVYETYSVNEYLRIYAICLAPDWKNFNIEEALFHAALEQAKLMKLTVAMTMCTSKNEEQMFERVGMKELAHVNYKEWDEESQISKNSKENSRAVIMTKKFIEKPESEDEGEISSIKYE